MRKLLATLMATGLMFGGAIAIAEAAPGPNGSNEHGLCTAYFNGQKKGHGDEGPPPFEALEAAADEADDEPDGNGTPEEVYEFCVDFGIGGNPEHGRYPDQFGEE